MNEHQCPQNKSEWDTASQRLQCVDPNSYHCLRTEDGGETEQCLGKVWIQEGMCPEYNSKVGKIDVFSCSHMPGCPTKIYWSNDVYQYHICSDNTSSATTTARSSDHTESSEEQSLPLDIIIPVVATVLALMLLVLGFIYIYIKRRKGQNNKKDKQRKEENHLTPFVTDDTLRGHLLTKDNNDEKSDSPYTKEEHSVEIHFSYSPKVEKIRQDTASKDALTSVDPSISDINDLEKYGVLIFISDDNIEIGTRIKIIKECGIFGKSNHVSPLDQWAPEEDVSLYIIRQPIGDLSSLSEFLRYNGDNLYQRVKSKEMYFVLCFERTVWQGNQLRLLKYDFFNNAKTRMI